MLFEGIKSSHDIALFTHTNPDGDALGSTLGMMGWLKDNGKKCTLFLPTPISDSLAFMVPDRMKKDIVVWDNNVSGKESEAIASYDLLIGLDFNRIDRIGSWSEAFVGAKCTKMLIDHHVGPEEGVFDHIISRTDVSSTCEIVYFLLKDAPGIEGDVSRLSVITREALLTGMTTDTNNFANSVYPSTLTMASELLASGTDRDKIIQQLFFCYPKRRIDAQGYILNRLLHVTSGGGAYIYINSYVQNIFGLKEGDTEGFVNIPLSIGGIKLSVLAKRERGSKKIRISVRSKKGTSAREFALKYFHGGGHELASGGKIIIGEDVATEHGIRKYLEKCIHDFLAEG